MNLTKIVSCLGLSAVILASATRAQAEEIHTYKCWARGTLASKSGRESKYDFSARFDATSEGAAVQQARRYFQRAYFQGVRVLSLDVTCRQGGEH